MLPYLRLDDLLTELQGRLQTVLATRDQAEGQAAAMRRFKLIVVCAVAAWATALFAGAPALAATAATST